ncbi:hypothetical protein COLO4_02676 [Corchorus olitorius]|uniref:Uncharacterized protein n=1 Tax=Corchorus olitorius TaxID=93759 RepID=A0A1R3L0K0_9ROSI|nr:hypothetical protein COLO4_02676 [Corchorus olitorius]
MPDACPRQQLAPAARILVRHHHRLAIDRQLRGAQSRHRREGGRLGPVADLEQKGTSLFDCHDPSPYCPARHSRARHSTLAVQRAPVFAMRVAVTLSPATRQPFARISGSPIASAAWTQARKRRGCSPSSVRVSVTRSSRPSIPAALQSLSLGSPSTACGTLARTGTASNSVTPSGVSAGRSAVISPARNASRAVMPASARRNRIRR